MLRLLLAMVWLGVAVASLGGAPAAAQEDVSREDALTAAYVYNFMKFAEWPPERFHSASAPIVLCVGSASRLKDAFQVLIGKIAGARPVRVVTLSADSDPAICHALFVDDGLSARLRQTAESAAVRGLLTVSDLPNFAHIGGQIGLVRANNQLRFQINLGAARRNGITFSSQLLRLAEVIGQQSGLKRVRVAMLRMTREGCGAWWGFVSLG